jgi:hypothetical protein
MDVLHAAWRGRGMPTPAGLTFAAGRCARCDTSRPVTPAGDVVSAKWTGWSSWRTAVNPALCAACSWAYRTLELRAGAFLITDEPSMTALTPDALLDALAGPLSPCRSVVLPLHRNRKHVLPEARWGRLCVDDTTLEWTAADADRLRTMNRLRRLGFSTSSMTRPAPPFSVLRKQTSGSYADVLRWWDQLRPWRPDTPWLAAAALVTGLATQSAAA